MIANESRCSSPASEQARPSNRDEGEPEPAARVPCIADLSQGAQFAEIMLAMTASQRQNNNYLIYHILVRFTHRLAPTAPECQCLVL